MRKIWKKVKRFIGNLLGKFKDDPSKAILFVSVIRAFVKEVQEAKEGEEPPTVWDVLKERLEDEFLSRVNAVLIKLPIVLELIPKNTKKEERLPKLIEKIQAHGTAMQAAIYMKLASSIIEHLHDVKENEADFMVQSTFTHAKHN